MATDLDLDTVLSRRVFRALTYISFVLKHAIYKQEMWNEP